MMYAQIELSQQTSDGYRSSIGDRKSQGSSFCANNHSEADIMPIGVYKHKPLSEEHKRKISEGNKGRKFSLET